MSVGRGAKNAAVVGALAAVQLALFAAYRSARAPSPARVFVAEAVPATQAPLLIVDRRGTRQPLAYESASTIVHFWATWCKPCREELPELMALAADERSSVKVIAVSVDETWEVIDHYFDGRAPPSVTRASHDDARTAFGIETLPASFLVDATGMLRFRLPGAQPWTTAEAREWLAAHRGAR